MSRSNPDLTNPAIRFFSWSGGKGKVVYWDKENKEEVEVKLPFVFLPLDQLATIKGYSKRDQSGYWANEVRNVTKEAFTVKTSKGTQQEGLYKELADVRAKGAKYTKSIYLIFKHEGEYAIGNFNASGSALTSWIELNNNYKVENGKVAITGKTHVPAANGISEYYIPTFEYKSCTPEENEIAIIKDRELQIYLNQYLATPKYEPEQTGDVVIEDLDEVGKATPEQVAAYDKLKAEKLHKNDDEDLSKVHEANPMNVDKVYDDIDPNEPINLDDIPF